MRIIRITGRILFFTIISFFSGCVDITEDDPCYKTRWPLPKTFEIKLAVHISSANPPLSGGAPGSEKPEDFDKLHISGTIQKFECKGETTGPVNLGNTYLEIGVDIPAPIYEPESYWFGHVVYVFDFDNDEDYLEIDLNVKATMLDGQSYVCNFKDMFDAEQITLVPNEMYYYILLDVYSDLWVKV